MLQRDWLVTHSGSQVAVVGSELHSPRHAQFLLERSGGGRGSMPPDICAKLERAPKWRALHARLEQEESAGCVQVEGCRVSAPQGARPLWWGGVEHARLRWAGNGDLMHDNDGPGRSSAGPGTDGGERVPGSGGVGGG